MSDSPPPEYSALPPLGDRCLPYDSQPASSSNQVTLGSHVSVLRPTLSLIPTYPDIAPSHRHKKSQLVLSPDTTDITSTTPRPPPTYTCPKIYRIGSQTITRPLVTIAEIKGHLALLHSFGELKRKVESTVVEVPHVPQDKERKWAWFVGLAVERFDVWCQTIKKEDSTKATHVVLPPVDVLMVWHSYMLNPRWYAEDCLRIPACQVLANFERHFKQLLKDPLLIVTEPAAERVDFWISNTRLGYDPLAEMHNMTRKSISCPKCNRPIQVDFMNGDGTGYFQRNFTTVCSRENCTLYSIKKETLAVRKLVQDLISKTSLRDAHLASHLAGTLFSQYHADKKKGTYIKQSVCESAERFSETLPWARGMHGDLDSDQLYLVVMEQCKYSMKNLKKLMGLPVQPLRLSNRIVNAYNDDKVYSVELVGAILRQGSFIDKMCDLGWTTPSFFDDPNDELVLQHAMARYHAFLDLMSSSRTSFIVPTLDIDLVWHTHQLSPEKYQADCNRYLRRFVDHDDRIEGSKLSTAFEDTCRAWKERYHIQYTHCGCPIEGNTIGERLSRMIGMASRATSSLAPFDRPDLLSSTHPSDHNAVRLVPMNKAVLSMEKVVVEKFTIKRQKEMDKATQKASKAGKSLLRARWNDELTGQSIPSSTWCTHDAAFLVPVPMYFGTTALNGGGCVPEGHVVSMFGGFPSAPANGCGALGGVMARGVCGTTPLVGFDGGACGGAMVAAVGEVER